MFKKEKITQKDRTYIISGEIEVIVSVLYQEAIGVIYQLKAALVLYIHLKKEYGIRRTVKTNKQLVKYM